MLNKFKPPFHQQLKHFLILKVGDIALKLLKLYLMQLIIGMTKLIVAYLSPEISLIIIISLIRIFRIFTISLMFSIYLAFNIRGAFKCFNKIYINNIIDHICCFFNCEIFSFANFTIYSKLNC